MDTLTVPKWLSFYWPIIILQSIANIFNCDFDESDQESLKLTQNIDSEH